MFKTFETSDELTVERSLKIFTILHVILLEVISEPYRFGFRKDDSNIKKLT